MFHGQQTPTSQELLITYMWCWVLREWEATHLRFVSSAESARTRGVRVVGGVLGQALVCG